MICPPLNKLNELARLTLEFCLTQTLPLTKDEIHQRFVQHFTANGYDKAGEWLWDKTVLVRPYVFSLAPLCVQEKQGIYDGYLQNQAIEDRFLVGSFINIPIPPVTQAAYDFSADLSRNFYKILCDGVPGDKINELEQLDRQTVLRAYLDAQKRIALKVCPGCDGKPPSISDGVIHEDLDHFFPKSKYPFLSIHPLNLTPFCKDCNQTYKRSRDAILDIDPIVIDVHDLNDIFHPYMHPAKDELAIEINCTGDDPPAFHFNHRPGSANQPARLHSLKYVLDIETRWTGDLDEDRIQALLENTLLYNSEEEREDENFVADEAWFDLHLRCCISLFQRGTGKIQNQVPAYIYAQWIRSDAVIRKKWLERAQIALKNYA
jgi:hypothetical protein